VCVCKCVCVCLSLTIRRTRETIRIATAVFNCSQCVSIWRATCGRGNNNNHKSHTHSHTLVWYLYTI